MRYIKNYNKLFESESDNTDDNKELVDDIIDIMSDITDSFDDVLFKSIPGSMRLRDYLSKNHRYDNFKPIYKGGNKLMCKFSIQFNNIGDYNKFSWVVNEMSSVIGRLSDLNFSLTNMNITTGNVNDYEPRNNNINDFDVKFVYYEFSKPSKVISDELPKVEDIVNVFLRTAPLMVHKGDVYIYDDYVDVGFEPNTYDGKAPDNIKEILNKVKDTLGFSKFEIDKNDSNGVRFWYN